MSVEGVWKVEMLGPYGWEIISTAILREGHFFAASAEHHSLGSYETDGADLVVKARVTQDGKVQTIFGETKKHVDMRIEAKQKKSGKIVGFAHPADNQDFDIKMRMTRLQKLD